MNNFRKVSFDIGGAPFRKRIMLKNIDANENLMKMRQKGVKLWRAILVATKEKPQKVTAKMSAI